MSLIAPSILSADFSRLGEEVNAVEAAGADWIHVDVMDGHFVPNITIGPLVVAAIRRVTKLPIDVHLMIENPEHYVKDFVQAGASWVSVHVEEGYHLDRSIQLIRECGAKPSIAINPATPVTALEPVLGSVDMVLLMSVNPGFGGQTFIPYSEAKIMHLRKMLDVLDNKVLLEIDGGVNTKNIGKLSKLGVDVFVAGSAIFGSKNYQQTIAQMKNALR